MNKFLRIRLMLVDNCIFSLPNSNLPPGVYTAVDLLTKMPVGEIIAENSGSFSYTPQIELPPGDGIILSLQPAQ